jgi:DNA-binding NarL/FixJ family response regulator
MRQHSFSAPETGDDLSDELSVPRKRVLVADDQARMLEVTAALLEESFDVVGLLSDGHAALEATLALEPDVVILDISMPGMNGIEVATELRQRKNTAKIVFLTVYEDALIRISCLAAGGSGYVVKEFMDSDLIPAMNEALAGHLASGFSSEQGND